MERENRELTGKKRSRRISVRNKKGMGRDEAGEKGKEQVDGKRKKRD